MKSTKYIIILLTFSLCISLIGCRNQNSSSPALPSSQSSTQDTLDEISPEDNISDLTASDGSATKPVNETQSEGNETKPAEKTDNEPTKPAQVTPPDTPAENVTKPEASQPEPTAQAYVAYYNMSAQEQQEFIDSFGSIEAFFAWHTIAKKAYEDNRTPIDGFNPIIP